MTLSSWAAGSVRLRGPAAALHSRRKGTGRSLGSPGLCSCDRYSRPSAYNVLPGGRSRLALARAADVERRATARAAACFRGEMRNELGVVSRFHGPAQMPGSGRGHDESSCLPWRRRRQGIVNSLPGSASSPGSWFVSRPRSDARWSQPCATECRAVLDVRESTT